MISITVNSEPCQVARDTQLADFLATYCVPGSQYAVAVNGEFVPRSGYSTHMLNAGDTVDIVSPVGGG